MSFQDTFYQGSSTWDGRGPSGPLVAYVTTMKAANGFMTLCGLAIMKYYERV